MMEKLIKKIWELGWKIWDHRNTVLHDQDNGVQKEEMDRLRTRL